MSYSRILPLFCLCCLPANLVLIRFVLSSSRIHGDQDATSIERLVEQLGSDSFQEREAATEALRKIGRRALPALRKAQSTTDAEIRRRAKTLLDRIDVTLESLLKRHALIRYYKNQMPSPKSVCEIDLVGAAFSDDDLTLVREFVNIRWLNLSGARITNAGLVQIGHLTSLERLDINDTSVSEISSLRKLSNLTWLELDGTKITDKDLEQIKHFPKVETLGLGITSITDAGLAHLKHLNHLHQLILCDTRITDKGLVYLSHFKDLSYLNLTHTQITDAGLVHLKKLKKLKHFIPHNTKLTAKGIDDLKKSLPGLE